MCFRILLLKKKRNNQPKAYTEKQTAVTLEAINKLRSSGLTGDQAVELYYMQLLHVNDALGKPFVAGPIPNTTQSSTVSVPANAVTTAPAAPKTAASGPK